MKKIEAFIRIKFWRCQRALPSNRGYSLVLGRNRQLQWKKGHVYRGMSYSHNRHYSGRTLYLIVSILSRKGQWYNSGSCSSGNVGMVKYLYPKYGATELEPREMLAHQLKPSKHTNYKLKEVDAGFLSK